MSQHEHPWEAPDLHVAPDPPADWKEWAVPLDWGILGQLPQRGARLGYHVLGTTVRGVKDALNETLPTEARVTSAQVSGRMKFLTSHGAAVQVRLTTGGDFGYQVTERGQRMLAAGEESLNGGD